METPSNARLGSMVTGSSPMLSRSSWTGANSSPDGFAFSLSPQAEVKTAAKTAVMPISNSQSFDFDGMFVVLPLGPASKSAPGFLIGRQGACRFQPPAEAPPALSAPDNGSGRLPTAATESAGPFPGPVSNRLLPLGQPLNPSSPLRPAAIPRGGSRNTRPSALSYAALGRACPHTSTRLAPAHTF